MGTAQISPVLLSHSPGARLFSHCALTAISLVFLYHVFTLVQEMRAQLLSVVYEHRVTFPKGRHWYSIPEPPVPNVA